MLGQSIVILFYKAISSLFSISGKNYDAPLTLTYQIKAKFLTIVNGAQSKKNVNWTAASEPNPMPVYSKESSFIANAITLKKVWIELQPQNSIL